MAIARNNPHIPFVLLLLAAVLTAWGGGVVVPACADSNDTSDWLWTYNANVRLLQPRFAPTATLTKLAGKDGILLVGGGNETVNPTNPFDKDFNTLISCEFYDQNQKVTPRKSLKQSRVLHTATELPGGKILVAGGLSKTAGATGVPGIVLPGSIPTCELFDPMHPDDNWTTFPRLNADRFAHTATLVNGKVLMAGGIQMLLDLSQVLEWKIKAVIKTLNSAEIYDGGTWKTTTMKQGRALHTATLLADGRVLVAGGASLTREAELDLSDLAKCLRDWHSCVKVTKTAIEVLDSTEIYDQTSGKWVSEATQRLTQPRVLHTATLLPGSTPASSRVLVAGGQDGFDQNSTIERSCEIYDSETKTWTLKPDRKGLPIPSSQHTATLLHDNKVLLVGGSVDPYASQVYDPKKDSWALTYDFLWFPRTWHTATRMPDNKVVVAGGVPWLYERYEPPSKAALLQRRLSGRVSAGVPGD
jgi:hypothetical protein